MEAGFGRATARARRGIAFDPGDSFVWIDFFSSSPRRAGHELRRMIQQSGPFALTGVVVAEVF
jgi:hypothetical protein